MSIYVISDLHLSNNTDKPMNIFGWKDYEEIIEKDWIKNVTDNDLVLLPGDFSWEMKLENTYKDFDFINKLPGKKLLLKGNHDYWWETIKKMREYLFSNDFQNIDFIYNNSYEYDDWIIAGTRGWNIDFSSEEDEKIVDREVNRLELSIQDGIAKYGTNKTIITCMHYPPLSKNNISTGFTKILEKYHVKHCFYGHLHGISHDEALEGDINGVNYRLISCDYLKFKLLKIR